MIVSILNERRQANDNRIIISTNLKAGLPLKDINKIAGPMTEAWAFEVFAGIRDDSNNTYSLINAEAQDRLGMADIILQFRKSSNVLTGNIDGIMEITDYNAYDLKFIGEDDLNYNPALGTGQIQVKDIHYVSTQHRTTWEMCQLLDRKYLHSSRRTINDFYREAVRNKWLKE